MDLIWNGFLNALAMILRGDPEVLQVVLRTFQVSGTATLLSLAIGVPLGTALALSHVRGRGFLISLVNTGMGMPPVVVGLVVSIMLWRSGPLGILRLMYTPTAMIVAQVVIATPLITGISIAAIAQLDPRLRLQMLGLGASRWQLLWVLFREARLPLLAAVMAGFGGAVSEVGAVMMVGGNVRGDTQVLTTAIVESTSRGEFDLALAFGIILLLLAYLVNLALTTIQQRGRLS
ncbi:MAG: ABC transporter permease [Chloroflexota bacterium]